MSIQYIPEGSTFKDAPLWWHLKGLSYTRSGYGNRIPTSRMIQFPNEKIWRRVYCIIWSNSGSYYVISKGQHLYLRSEFYNYGE